MAASTVYHIVPTTRPWLLQEEGKPIDNIENAEEDGKGLEKEMSILEGEL